MRHTHRFALSVLALSGMIANFAVAQETAMWGGTPSRNMVSDETGLPTEWDPDTGQNIKWSVGLGSQTYGGPVLIGDMVLVGTNNQSLRNPKHTGDRGVVMAFNAEDGEFLWQASHTKLPAGRVNDWPQQGVCSTPFIEGDRLWYISNQAHIVCADLEGFRDGENDGPITDEADTSDIDADFIWSFDMMEELDAFPHNLAVCSPIVVGDLIFVVTGNGVDEGHLNIPSPFAPSFVALNKNTGELVWEDASPGMAIVHGQWSNPAYGVAGGTPQVIFPGGATTPDGEAGSLPFDVGIATYQYEQDPALWQAGVHAYNRWLAEFCAEAPGQRAGVGLI
ncbi:MAG: PQQ-binding-like beta-propeller repeat protein, partial [Candidatus Poribacteria bacterium]